MKQIPKDCFWEASQLGTAIHILTHESKLSEGKDQAIPATDWNMFDEQGVEKSVFSSADLLNIEAESLGCTYGEFGTIVRRSAPAIIKVQIAGQDRYLALSSKKLTKLVILKPNHTKYHASIEQICQLLRTPLEAPLIEEVNRIVDHANIPDSRKEKVHRLILQEQLKNHRTKIGWTLRVSPRSTFLHQIRHAGVIHRFFGFIGVHALQYLLWLSAWFVLGRGILQDISDSGWLWGWALLLIALTPLRPLLIWLQGQISIRIGAILKTRLMVGTLHLHPDQILHQGIGGLLGRVIESEAVETLALNGGFLVILAIIELIYSFGILALGVGQWSHAILLAMWLLFTLWQAWRYLNHRLIWTDTRLDMTNELVEKMVGHRTRLAQEEKRAWHLREDDLLTSYLRTSTTFDSISLILLSVTAQGWLVIGLAGLVPSFISGIFPVSMLALSIGGILTSYQALRKLSGGLLSLTGAVISWHQISLLYKTGALPTQTTSSAIVPTDRRKSEIPRCILQARGLTFRYSQQSEFVLNKCNFEIYYGERVLLEGTSGSGKSTLASVVAGLRKPHNGLLFLNGLDRSTWGTDEWRNRIAFTPQFHENHVLTETFAFNLLMGRKWPPDLEDIQKAITICQELGLGELLERMPGGIFQMVGDTGWQLSHGERSRLYIARSILQEAELIILDESLAALDPESLQTCLRCVLKHSPTLLLIAHP